MYIGTTGVLVFRMLSYLFICVAICYYEKSIETDMNSVNKISAMPLLKDCILKEYFVY